MAVCAGFAACPCGREEIPATACFRDIDLIRETANGQGMSRIGVTEKEKQQKRSPAMSSMIPAEMMGGAIQAFVYLMTAVAALLSFFMTVRA